MANPVSNSVVLPPVNAGNGTLTDEFLNGLIEGGSWQFAGGARVLTYSFNVNWDFDEFGNIIQGVGGSWTASFTSAVNRALAEWSNVANITFQNIASGRYQFESDADIAFTLTGDELQSDPVFPLVALGIFPDPAIGAFERDFYAQVYGINYPKPEGDISIDNYFSGFQYLNQFANTAGFGFDAILHEIGHALGLKHPDDDGGNGRPTFAQLGITAYDVARWTIMSNNPNPGSTLQMGNDISPMPLDILAVQQIYGANNSYHAGDDDYQLGPYTVFGNAGTIYRTLWDAGGVDTIRTGGLSDGISSIGVSIDLHPGTGFVMGQNAIPGQAPYTLPSIPPVFNPFSLTFTAIAYNVIIENAFGSPFSDSIVGNDANNLLDGKAGADVLGGVDGDDTLIGGPGNDTLDGGGGNDIADFSGSSAQHAFVSYQGALTVADRVSSRDGVDVLTNIEQLAFAFATVSISDLDAFTPLDYIASYGDLASILGTNAAAGYDHLLKHGLVEGRVASFNAAEYIASYVDLINALGANVDAGASHFITHGRFEGRTVNFSAFEYIASYADLANALGANIDAGAHHYIHFGRSEGRKTTFDGLEYVASYPDLMNALGASDKLGAQHYLQYGRTEGRQESFEGLEYIASYGDLITALGPNRDAGTMHYINHGRFEGRTEHFNPAQYLANYADLQAAFGTDQVAATIHFIQYGYFEGRTDLV